MKSAKFLPICSISLTNVSRFDYGRILHILFGLNLAQNSSLEARVESFEIQVVVIG